MQMNDTISCAPLQQAVCWYLHDGAQLLQVGGISLAAVLDV